MNVVLTGGTGFLGQALLRGVRPAGVQVRALVRRAADEPLLRTLDAEPVRGDLADADGAVDLVRPGDTLIHAAARVDVIGTAVEYRRGTVDTTRHLLDAALPRRPARVVYISSAAVYTSRPDPANSTGFAAGRTPTTPARWNRYGRAKLAAERLVQERCAAAGVPWTIVRLGFLYGPGNHTLARQLCDLQQRQQLLLVGRGDNRIATLYIDDAADGVWRAATAPAAAGRIYDLASDEAVTQAEFIGAHARALGLPPVARHVPTWLARFGGAASEVIAGLLRQRPVFSRMMVALMAADQRVDNSAAQADLGWHAATPFADGVARFAAWWAGQQAGAPSAAAMAGGSSGARL